MISKDESLRYTYGKNLLSTTTRIKSLACKDNVDVICRYLSIDWRTWDTYGNITSTLNDRPKWSKYIFIINTSFLFSLALKCKLFIEFEQVLKLT